MSRSDLAGTLALAFAAFLAAGPSAALEENEDCVFFPHLRCGRTGRYEGFVQPASMPYYFEDPFITTGVTVHGIWHDFPNDSVFEGGELWALAVQARIAITDRLAFIATKDGFVWFRPDQELLRNEEGFWDIAAGFKYALVDMPEKNFILTPSLRFEIPVGEKDLFAGEGDGQIIPAVSAAWGLGDFHVIADLGGRIPFDRDEQSTSFFYNLHLDYALLDFFVPFVEFGGTHWTDSGNGRLDVRTRSGAVPSKLRLNTVQAVLPMRDPAGDFEGVDVVNLGSKGVGGNDLATFAAGARVPITDQLSVAAYYEFPMTKREDVFNQRAAVVLTFEY